MADNTHVNATADYWVRDTDKGGYKVQHFALDLGGSGESVLTQENPMPVVWAPLTIRYDEGATYGYLGQAAPGTSESSATWQIKRLTLADNVLLFADGDANFDNVWSDRGSLNYL